MAKEYPADACGAICLSFRALSRLSSRIGSTNLEMNQKYLLNIYSRLTSDLGTVNLRFIIL